MESMTDKEKLNHMRHTLAHLLAAAILEIHPDAKNTIGPAIDDGFYYDFSFERPFTPEDLAGIEQVMSELASRAIPVVRKLVARDEAVRFFLEKGEAYKAEIISQIPGGQAISLYEQEEFVDLCRGPHVPDTGKLQAFKLMKIAGAYWRGDPKNEVLQRIYGTAWSDKKDLKAYLTRLEEAERRDHRKIAKTLDLFHMQEEAPGMVFWHPKGWVLWQVIEHYMRGVFRGNGYQEIRTPLVVSKTLWEKSGHWDKFQADMFTTASESRDYAIKPMNCPCHIQVYNQGLKSYRDLPLRLAEFGSCHRNELSGVLHGLMRVRGFTQDDAHIFCAEDQVQSEVSAFIDLLHTVYADFGFDKVLIKLSTRPQNRVGSDEVWDKAEAALETALNAKGLDWQLQPGEGAFYGPKIEFSLKDCLDRVWQCGTIQVDFSMPERLGAVYVAEDGGKRTPVMLHRAILGSLERFIGILIEHYAGYFPLWLAPVQAVVFNITDAQSEYAQQVANELTSHGLRVDLDLRNEKIGFKIREHSMQRVPYLIVVGEKEKNNGTASLRTQKGEDLGAFQVSEILGKMTAETANRS